MNKDIALHVHNLKQTEQLTKFLLKILKKPIIICLYGEIGVGKTQFTKFFAKNLGITKILNSATFNKMQIYEINHQEKLVHLDGYHLNDQSDLGFCKDYLNESYVIIEWPEIFLKYLKDFIKLNLFFEYTSNDTTRKIKINGENWILKKIQNEFIYHN